MNITSGVALGPFLERDIFPLYGQQAALHNLVLSRQGQFVGLDKLIGDRAHLRADEDTIQWRATVQLSVHERHNGDILLPHLTTHGSALVKALARSRDQRLQSPALLLIQGSTARAEWSDQGQLILYSERPNGRRSFVVESINLDSPERSFLVLRSYYLLHWMSKVKNTEGNHPTDIACYVNKYMEEYPCLVSGNGTQTHPSHIRRALASILMFKDARERINAEKLFTNDALVKILYEYLELQEIGLIQREDSSLLADGQLRASSPRRGRQLSDDKPVLHGGIQDMLLKIPMHYFDIPSILPRGGAWRCPEDHCQTSIPTGSSIFQSHDDEQLLQFRRNVQIHLWKHLEERGLAECLQNINATASF